MYIYRKVERERRASTPGALSKISRGGNGRDPRGSPPLIPLYLFPLLGGNIARRRRHNFLIFRQLIPPRHAIYTMPDAAVYPPKLFVVVSSSSSSSDAFSLLQLFGQCSARRALSRSSADSAVYTEFMCIFFLLSGAVSKSSSRNQQKGVA